MSADFARAAWASAAFSRRSTLPPQIFAMSSAPHPSASKAAVTGFAHALRQELAREGIRVTLVHPGPCATPLVDGYIGGEYYPVPPGVPVIAPDQVARAIWRGIRKGRREVFVPRRLAVTAWLAGIAPGAVDGTYRLLDRGKRGK